MYHGVYYRMNYTQIISIVAFAVIILCALFLFIRNYPSDKEFSVVFVVAGGVCFYNSIKCNNATSSVKDISETSK
jgi:hypothetical protein